MCVVTLVVSCEMVRELHLIMVFPSPRMHSLLDIDCNLNVAVVCLGPEPNIEGSTGGRFRVFEDDNDDIDDDDDEDDDEDDDKDQSEDATDDDNGMNEFLLSCSLSSR